MRRVWDGILGIIVTLFIVNAMLEMIRPYAWQLAISVVVFVIAQRTIARYRRW